VLRRQITVLISVRIVGEQLKGRELIAAKRLKDGQ
jgi:hypothetical protein